MGLIYKTLGKYPTNFKEFQDKLAKLNKLVSSGTITVKSRFVHSLLPETGRDKTWLEYVARDVSGKKLTKLVESYDKCMYCGLYGYDWVLVNTPNKSLEDALNLAHKRAKEIKFKAVEESVRVYSFIAEIITKYLKK